MTIQIATRFRPFSHVSPTLCLIPRTRFAAEICPVQLKIFDPENGKVLFEKKFTFGPLKEFTVTLDLEKEFIEVSGFSKNGFIRYHITPGQISFLKGSDESFQYNCDAMEHPLRARLSFGVHKAQDAALMFRRLDLQEILPHLFLLAQSVPKIADTTLAFDLMPDFEKIQNFIQAGFKSLFFPRLDDETHLGFPPLRTDETQASPLVLLQKLYPIIVQFFFQESTQEWHFLPHLPKDCHVGRVVDFVTAKGHTLSIEWTKKTIRQVTITAFCDDHYSFKFSPDIKRCRLSTKTDVLDTISNNAEIPLQKGVQYRLDRFEG